MKEKFATVCVFLAGVLWGTMGIFVRHYNEAGMDSMDIVAIRAIVTTFIMFIFLLIYNRELLKIKLKDLWCFLGTGLLSILFFNFCYFKAITVTSLSVAAVLLYTAPAIVMILSRFLFKEKFSIVKVIALISTFVGCVFVTGIIGSGKSLSIVGILIGLGAGLGYALYSIFSRYALEKGYHTYTIIFYTFLITTIGVLPISNVVHIGKVCIDDGRYVLFSLVFGLVSTVLPYILYTVGLKHVENGKASIIASIEPVVATILGIVVFKEKLNMNGIVGIILVLGAIIICNIGHEDTKNSN